MVFLPYKYSWIYFIWFCLTLLELGAVIALNVSLWVSQHKSTVYPLETTPKIIAYIADFDNILNCSRIDSVLGPNSTFFFINVFNIHILEYDFRFLEHYPICPLLVSEAAAIFFISLRPAFLQR